MLIVEDNTGLSNADSYISTSDAAEYFLNYGGGDSFNMSNSTVQEQALRNATRLVDGLIRWIGTKLEDDQALEWPRKQENNDGTFDTLVIPIVVKDAVCDMAELWLNDDIVEARVIEERYGDTSVKYADAYVEGKFVEIKRRLLAYGAFKSTVVTTYRA
jgi:hypothetical protein